jgi:type IV pilus assembly protein PilA
VDVTKVRERAMDEQGFTLIELLVVIIIIGILAAIAIPSFLNQTSKAFDASAKELAHSATIATESYATDHAGSYAGVSPAIINQYESTIPIAPAGGNAYVSTASGTASSYTILIIPGGGRETYTIMRNSNGSTTRTCTPSTGLNGGCSNGTW